MTITLNDALVNAQDDVDFHVIDEFRKDSHHVLDRLTFDDSVVPGATGAALIYGYTRVTEERGAAFRQQNTEYTPADAKRQRFTVPLSPLGGSYTVDRVLANVGPAATNEIAFQTGQLIKSSQAKFADEFINGVEEDFANAAPGFDGIDAAVTGTSTESFATGSTPWDWDTIDSKDDALLVKRAISGWLDSMDGVDVLYVNKDGKQFLEFVADYIGYFNSTVDEFGRRVSTFRDIPFVDLGAKAGTTADIISTDAGVTSIYAVRFGLDGVHGAAVAGGQFVRTWLPDFSTAGAVKKGEAELGPVGLAIKATKSIGALRMKVE